MRVVAVEVRIGNTTWRVPSVAAPTASRPPCQRRNTLSSTTMALSTIRPNPIASPISVSRLRVMPPK